MRYVGAIAITILVVLGTIYLSGVNLGNNKEVIYKNVWINSVKDKDIECIVKGKIQRFKLASKSSEMIKSGIADLVIEGDKVVKISIKPSVIKGKLIAVDNDYVEINLHDYDNQYSEFAVEVYSDAFNEAIDNSGMLDSFAEMIRKCVTPCIEVINLYSYSYISKVLLLHL